MFASLPVFGALSQPFKRAQFGLFGGKTKQYGNNVPFSKHKTRRTWLPNVQRKRLPSETLGQTLRLKVTTRALRTIKKYGGLDNYLKGNPAHKLSFAGQRILTQIKDKESQNRKDYLKSKEGRIENQRRIEAQTSWGRIYGGLVMNLNRTATLLEGETVEAARRARQEATKALGLATLASAQQTMQYLKEKR